MQAIIQQIIIKGISNKINTTVIHTVTTKLTITKVVTKVILEHRVMVLKDTLMDIHKILIVPHVEGHHTVDPKEHMDLLKEMHTLEHLTIPPEIHLMESLLIEAGDQLVLIGIVMTNLIGIADVNTEII